MYAFSMSASFAKSLLRNSLLFSIILAVLLVSFLGYFAYVDHQKDIQLLEERYVEAQKDSLVEQVHWFKNFIEAKRETAEEQLRSRLRSEVNEAAAILKGVIQNIDPSVSMTKRMAVAKEALRPIRFFDGRGYFFMFDVSGVEVLFSVHPVFEGMNLLDMENSEGKLVVKEMIDVAVQSGAGFYQYSWSKPGADGDHHQKLSYVKHIPELGVVLGAGEYLEDALAQIQENVLDMLQETVPAVSRYFFAGTYDGTSMLGPARGKNMLHVRDVNGFRVVEELIQKAKHGGGFVSYELPAVDKDYATYSKLSYVDAEPDWGWYVGAGLSLEDQQVELALQKQQMATRFLRDITVLLLIVLMLSGGFFMMTRKVVDHVQTNIHAIGDSFQEAALAGSTIPYHGGFYDEFSGIRKAANDLISVQSRQRYLKSVMLEISQRVHSANTLEDLLELIHELMIREVGAENFFVALINEETDTLEFQYCVDKMISTCPVVPNVSEAQTKRLSLLPIRRNKRVLVSKAELEALCDDGVVDIHGELPETWLGIPLQVRGVPIGVMVTQDYDTPSSYSHEDLQLIDACSDQIALGIERKRYTDFTESARDIFTRIPSGMFIYDYSPPNSLVLINANPAAEAITGIRLEDWKGSEFDAIWGDSAQDFKEAFLSPLRTGQDYVSESLMYGQRQYHIRTFFMPGERLGVAFEDITEQNQVELAIRESEELHRALFQNNHSVVLVLDGDTGAILDSNKAAQAFYRYSREELSSMRIHDINVASETRVTGLMQKTTQGGIGRFVARHKWANGVVRDVEVFAGPFTAKGKTHVVSIIHDITERLRSERQLAQAKDAAEIANVAKDEFLANISHEVRTPLNGVMGMLQLIHSTRLDDEQEELVSTALQSSSNLLRVLNDVLDFSKIEAGKLELHEEVFDLPELLDQCVNLFKLQMDEKKLSMTSYIHPDAAGYFIGDQARIRQVLFNLLGNSTKFTDSGNISVEVYPMPGRIEGREQIFFSVEDSGIGIPKNKLHHIFKSFAQVDGSSSRQHQGTGLGLPIVERLVKLMDGQIFVESEEGVGSTFSFCISVAKSDSAPETVVSERVEGMKSLRVLLVEDDRVNRIMAQRLLEKEGHAVVCAENGMECLNTILTQPFDVVLMDMQMPILDGIEATKHIRGDKNFVAIKDIPIVALTAHALKKDRRRAMAAGMTEYLSKPFEQKELNQILYAAVSATRS